MKSLLTPSLAAALLWPATVHSAPSATLSPVEAEGQAVGREHMVGNQTRNRGMTAVPAPGKVTIDGALGDWDLSGRISSFADINLKEQYSVETALMWDAEYLYVALKWKDRTPMFNTVDPEFELTSGWKSDSFQMRMVTDQVLWLTAWQYTGKKQSTLMIEAWKDPKDSKGGLDKTILIGKPGAIDLGEGAQMALKADGNGYVQEMRIPWKLLYKQAPSMQAGAKIQIGFEYFWGDATGNTWPEHRYADNLKPGENKIQFFWTSPQIWGDVALSGAGSLPLRQYRAEGSKLNGPMVLSFPIPEKARRFTVVIEDAAGRRIRNLAADINPADYATSQSEGAYQVQIRWDGRDDDGKLVPEGTYRARGLSHEGIVPKFDTVFYNPGTPPWDNAKGTGAWAADHAAVSLTARSGDTMVLACHFAEGGHGIIGIGPDGKKTWGEKRGAICLTGDDSHVYAIINSWGRSGLLCRFDGKTGAYAPFESRERTLPFEVALKDVIPGYAEPDNSDKKEITDSRESLVTSMAASGGHLYLSLRDGRLVVLQASDLSPVATHALAGLGDIACGPDGSLYGLIGGALHHIDAKSGQAIRIPTPGLEKAGSLAVRADGTIAVMDLGKDYQIKAYTSEGKLAGTFAQKGGRPIRGAYEPGAVAHVSSVAFDSQGRLWAAEHWENPRRVSVWGKEGKLDHDYIGNTGYAGVGAYLDDDDPALGHVGAVEMQLRPPDGYAVTSIIWAPDPARPEEPDSFAFDPQSNSLPRRFRSKAGGMERDYIFVPRTYWRAEPTVLFMKDDHGWRPVFAMGYVGMLSGKIGPKGNSIVEQPSGAFAGLDAKDGFFWNDFNSDGAVQRDECEIIPAKEGKQKGAKDWAEMNFGSGWNNTINPGDLTFLTSGIMIFRPERFTDKGAPVYTSAGRKMLVDTAAVAAGTPYRLASENLAIALQTLGGSGKRPNFVAYDIATGKERWHYPNDFPGVHASHRAPMASAGLLIGPLKILGAAKVDGLGEVFTMRGNLGEDFYFTGDGLYIGAVFRDGRFPSDSLPAKVGDLAGKALSDYSEGGEPFSGWFGRQKDGKIRMTTSLVRQGALVVEITGLDKIRRFDGPEIEVGNEAAKAFAAYVPENLEQGAAKSLTISRVTTAPALEDNKAWESIPTVELTRNGSPEKASVRLAYDEENLYVAYDLADASPMKNEGKDFKRLFKTGDALDLQIGTKPFEKRSDPGLGDSRILLSFLEGRPAAVLMRATDPGSTAKHFYSSPVGSKSFDRVEVRDEIRIAAAPSRAGYVVRAAIPWKTLGISPKAGMALYGDFGFISSDAEGKINVARTYWSNANSGLVNDEPFEAWFKPESWGTLTLGK